MAKRLSDERNSGFNDRLDEFKRRVQNGNINFDSAMDALNRIIHREALSKNPVKHLVASGIFKDFSWAQAIVAANLLELDGFVLNLVEQDRIDSMLRCDPDTCRPRRAIFMDIAGFKQETIEHGINVSWWWTTRPTIEDSPRSQGLDSWPIDYRNRIKKLGAAAVKDQKLNAILLTSGSIITI